LNPNRGEGYISANENGIFANIDDMMYDTSAVTSRSAYSANYVSAWTYTYNSATLDVEYVDTLPEVPDNKLYIIG
jgi:hypothetical protein